MYPRNSSKIQEFKYGNTSASLYTLESFIPQLQSSHWEYSFLSGYELPAVAKLQGFERLCVTDYDKPKIQPVDCNMRIH